MILGHKIHGQASIPEGNAFQYGQCAGSQDWEQQQPNCYKDFEEKQKKLSTQNYFIEEVEKLPDIQVNGPKEEEKAAPQIVSVSFRGVRSEVLLHALEGTRGVFAFFRLCLLFQQETAGERSIEKKSIWNPIFWIPHSVSASAMRRQRKNWITVWRIWKELLPVLRKYARH